MTKAKDNQPRMDANEREYLKDEHLIRVYLRPFAVTKQHLERSEFNERRRASHPAVNTTRLEERSHPIGTLLRFQSVCGAFAV